MRASENVLNKDRDDFATKTPLRAFAADRNRLRLLPETRQAGFTLIELVLVVLLLGLMASLGIPALSNMEPDGLAASTRRLAGTVKYLYNEAAMSGVEHRLIFNLDDGSYEARRLSPSGELETLQGVAAKHSLSEGVRFLRINQPGRGEQNSGTVTTAFLPSGWLEPTIIHLQDAKKRQMTLRLAPLTGLTEIYEGDRDFQ